MLWEKVNFAVNSKKIFNLLLRGWFRIKGRSSRLEYILRFNIMFLLLFLCNIAEKIFNFFSNNSFALLLIVILWGFLTVILILSVIQVFFVTHRRLHDLNASGWWQLITIIPLGQILMICFIFFKGTKGSNKYGLPPEY